MAIDEDLIAILDQRLELAIMKATKPINDNIIIMNNNVDNIRKTLNGNGKKGLCEEIEEMKGKDTCHDNFILEYKTEKKFIIAIAVFVSGLITTAIKLFWK